MESGIEYWIIAHPVLGTSSETHVHVGLSILSTVWIVGYQKERSVEMWNIPYSTKFGRSLTPVLVNGMTTSFVANQHFLDLDTHEFKVRSEK